MKNNFNLDFTKKTKVIEDDRPATLQDVQNIVEPLMKKIAEDQATAMNGLLSIVSVQTEAIAKLEEARTRDMNFILDVISGGKYDRKVREAYLSHCQEYERLKEEKNDSLGFNHYSSVNSINCS